MIGKSFATKLYLQLLNNHSHVRYTNMNGQKNMSKMEIPAKTNSEKKWESRFPKSKI